jgi:hypothetical protein
LKETDAEAERDPAWITARQEYYIRGLWDLASRKKDVASQRAMTRRVGGADDIRFLRKKDAGKVILALRDICRKAGSVSASATPATGNCPRTLVRPNTCVIPDNRMSLS